MADKKYVTISEGIDFRTISKILTQNGYRMNHATARNQLIVAMEKLLVNIALQANNSKNFKAMESMKVDELLKDPKIHEYLGDILFAAHKEEMKERNES